MPNCRSSEASAGVIKYKRDGLLFCLSIWAVFLILSQPSVTARAQQTSIHGDASSANEKPPYLPVYRILLRVHLGKSERSPSQFRKILDEINSIWWSQAGICFESEAVHHDKPLDKGIDIWFMPVLKEYSSSNGYYKGDHEIYVRDTPILGPALHPAHSSAARTAAHELGHALGLYHRQDSDDNLMRSKTFGWQLSPNEIQHARSVASRKAIGDISPLRCGTPKFTIN